MLFSPTRGGMDIQVRSLDGSKFKESKILKKHDMIINTLLVDEDLLLSAGWDSRLLIWVKLFLTTSESFQKHSIFKCFWNVYSIEKFLLLDVQFNSTIITKDLKKGRHFVLDIVAFIFNRSTSSQTSWRENFCSQPTKSQNKQSSSPFTKPWS